MKYLILSPISLSLFLVPRLGKSKEVEKIYFWIGSDEVKKTGENMENFPGWEKFEKVADYNEVLNKESKENLIILIDDVNIGETGLNLRKRGYKVIGGTPHADKMERDRDFAQETVKGIIDIPETYSFESFPDGIGFLKSRQKDESFYFKPNDENTPKDYTFHGKTVPELIDAMRIFQSEWKWKESFQIQKEVKGVLFDFSAYFNSKGEILPNSIIYYFENKPVANGDIGVQTGGAIAVQFAHELKGQFYEILNKLKPRLLKDGYSGQIAINTIISEETKKPSFLEFCGRLGYPSLPLDISLIEDAGHTAHSLFSALVEGTTPTLFPLGKISTTVWVGIPPYPYKDGVEKNAGTPISWDKKWDEYFFPYYVKYDSKKGMVAAGTGGEIVQCTCVDSTLPGATDMMYNQYMPTLKAKNMLFRTDCGEDARKRIEKLREWRVI